MLYKTCIHPINTHTYIVHTCKWWNEFLLNNEESVYQSMYCKSWCDKMATNVCHRKRYGSKCQHIFNEITIITYKIMSLRCSITNVIYLSRAMRRSIPMFYDFRFGSWYAVWFLFNQYNPYILWFTINFIAFTMVVYVNSDCVRISSRKKKKVRPSHIISILCISITVTLFRNHLFGIWSTLSTWHFWKF